GVQARPAIQFTLHEEEAHDGLRAGYKYCFPGEVILVVKRHITQHHSTSRRGCWFALTTLQRNTISTSVVTRTFQVKQIRRLLSICKMTRKPMDVAQDPVQVFGVFE